MVALLHAGSNLAETNSETDVGGTALLRFIVAAVVVVLCPRRR